MTGVRAPKATFCGIGAITRQMATDLTGFRLFVGLVSFGKGTDDYQTLPPEAAGAVGWMAGRAQNEDQFVELIRLDLAEMGFPLLEVDDIAEIDEISEARALDEHLAQNMEQWELGKMTVWGGLHPYLGEGEA